ncbi:Zinc/iron permease [Cylindrobasidium torrendii FP15055 ss-10]|uniref:Zinc/iron permease n=1 Tax=Cylindrobasidium torrendii FP15055 ss-10 TaxID=1314674 RepID=A0A0D7BSD7_9AGAR|nr:Zinc/iron permease [Cylindrobasidium torrendii FP15055 ss-10]
MLPDSLSAAMLDEIYALEAGVSTRRMIAMGAVFVLSLFAVSFPSISQRSRRISIPKIFFFIGKHFGTGVILSTAFCHLLQDSFEALTSRAVKEEYGSTIGKQTGLIILASLLAIFIIEYVSTSYVDHLHGEPSQPPSPAPSIQEIPSCSNAPVPDYFHNNERTPLLSDSQRSQTMPHPAVIPPQQRQHYLTSIVNSPRHSRSTESFYIINDLNYHVNNGEYQLIGGRGGCVCVCVCKPGEEQTRLFKDSHISRPATPMHEEPVHKHVVGRKRKVVGILVLQLGIMIHSLVIGLTLSITRGAEFTTLLTAIVFHQLFEGLSLGIRIASLPPPSSSVLPAPSTFVGRSRQQWLQPTLAFLFAVTTPAGMGLGMAVFAGTTHSQGQMQLTQGLMSAISAGMLIYAATVEMLAGDFVFGNLQGGHEHGHGAEEEENHEPKEAPTMRRKIIALASLLAGVAGMSLVGIGE